MNTLWASAREALICRREAIERQARERPEASTAASTRRRRHPSASRDDAEELREIDAALERIAKGSFGHCEHCGNALGRQRLRAVPEARHCTDCEDHDQPSEP